MELTSGTCKIEVKLLASGRYVWSIAGVSRIEDGQGFVDRIKSIDRELRTKFPDFAVRGSSKSVDIEE